MHNGIYIIFSMLIAHLVQAASYTVRGSLDPSILPLSSYDASVTQFVLRDRSSHVDKKTSIHTNGEFVFHNMSEGSYLLWLSSATLDAPTKYAIEIRDSQIEVKEAYVGHDLATDLGPRVSYPIVITPITRTQYVFPRQAFSVLGMLKSPMMLMSIGSMFLVFIMPKLVENIDPETIQAVQEHNQQREEVMNKVTNFDVAQFMAGKSSSSDKKNTNEANSQ